MLADAEVVGTAEEASGLGRSPLLTLDLVERFLDEHGLGDGPLSASRLGEGSSNVTFLLERGEHRYVLRRPPRPPLPPTAHDVVREARLQLALSAQGRKVPTIVALDREGEVLGVPFYVAEYIDADVVTRVLPPVLAHDAGERERLIDDVVDTLAEIHSTDLDPADIAAFVRPGNYLDRQVRRFSSLWEVNATREIPAVAEVGAWLRARVPEPVAQAVVHGDYRLGNLMVSRDRPARIVAVLDWEMGTVGDPRADVGYLTATYTDARSYGTPLELSPVTALSGFPPRERLIERYERTTGHDLGPLAWFETLALWKAAVFCEAIYGRFLRGELDHDPFAERLGDGVPVLARAAAEIAGSA